MINFIERFRNVYGTQIRSATICYIIVNNFTDRTDSVSAPYSFLKSKLIIWRYKKAFIAFNNTMFKYFWNYRTNGNDFDSFNISYY